MMKICTDVEQSNKLIELGIDVNTADMCYHFIKINKTPLCIRWEKVHDDEKDNSVPAWSLAALLELLPKRIEIVDNVYELSVYLYGLYYWNINNGNLCFESKDKDNLVDACYEAIVFLHEQKLSL